jgi:hypothetical protein
MPYRFGNKYIVTVNMPGYSPEGDSVESFEALPTAAIDALLDEAFHALDAECCEDFDPAECMTCSDRAYIDTLRGSEGRADLLFTLEQHREVSIRIESFANSYGGIVTLTEVVE